MWKIYTITNAIIGSFETEKLNDYYSGHCPQFQNLSNMFQKQDLFLASRAKGGKPPVQLEPLKRIRLHHCTLNRSSRSLINFILPCKKLPLIPVLYITISICKKSRYFTLPTIPLYRHQLWAKDLGRYIMTQTDIWDSQLPNKKDKNGSRNIG